MLSKSIIILQETEGFPLEGDQVSGFGKYHPNSLTPETYKLNLTNYQSN